MKYSQEQPPIPTEYDPQYFEGQLKELREYIYLLRQFLEPMVLNNKDTPDQVLDPLD